MMLYVHKTNLIWGETDNGTSKSRARRAAEVSKVKDFDTIGSKDKVCLQEMQRILAAS